MEKLYNIHSKANKLFDDVCKKKCKIQNNPANSKLNTDHVADLPYKCCIYCQKVFINSKFLMKHILRRHSDELVFFFKNHTDPELKSTSDDLQRLITVLKEEFSELKKELASAKLAVNGENETEAHTTEDDKVDNTIQTQVKSADFPSKEICDLREKIVDVEQDIQNLNDKFIQLDNVLKNDVLTKDDVNEKLALSEEKIMQAQQSQFFELRQILLNELKSLLNNQQLEMSSEWKSQMLELRHEIKRLDLAIDNAKQQLKCADSLKEEIKKELIPQIVPHISSRKCSKRKHLLLNSELSSNKSQQTSLQQELSSNENINRQQTSRSKSFKGVTFRTNERITSMVADKLSQFSIYPNTSKISCSEFNKILRLLNFEKEQNCKKYPNFLEIYNKLNILADEKALNKLKTQKHSKITLADPLTSSKSNLNHSTLVDDVSMHEQSLSIQHKNKQFVSKRNLVPSDSKNKFSKEAHHTHKNKVFTFSDKGASGDAILLTSDKQNIPMYTKLCTIRENETSHAFEDREMSKDMLAKSSKDVMTVTTKRTKNVSPREPKNHSIQSTEKFEFPEEDDCSNSTLFPNKHNMHIKPKKFLTSSPIRVNENRKLKTTVVMAEYSKFNRRQNCISPVEYKLNTDTKNYSVQCKDNLVFKTVDKCTELETYDKFEDDFDDVSSLETYKSSDDDDHTSCS